MRSLCLSMAILCIAALSPLSARAGDQEVAQQIAAGLKNSGRLKDYSVGVKVSGNTAWLAGHVRSEQQMAAALEIAQQTPGIEQVVNNITVSPNGSSDGARPSRQSATRGPAVTGAVTPASATMPAAPLPLGMQDSPQLEMPAHTLRPTRPSNQVHQGMTPEQAAQMQMQMQMMQMQGGPGPGQMASAPNGFMPGAAGPMPGQMGGMPGQMAGMPGQMGGMPGNCGPGCGMGGPGAGGPIPTYPPGVGGGVAPARYDQPNMPCYAWPSYAAYPNYAALSYPKQYSPTAWPYIGPFYPYPQVPLGWRKVTLEWDDGWWQLDFKDHH